MLVDWELTEERNTVKCDSAYIIVQDEYPSNGAEATHHDYVLYISTV